MDNELHKKYGLMTAICMVVGIVVGSGVFFKAERSSPKPAEICRSASSPGSSAA